MLNDYQENFIQFLIESKALLFGEFKLKSGRLAPYFINSGNFNSGSLIAELGRFYAAHIVKSNLGKVDVIFGPAYKGIPLAVTTSISLARDFDADCSYCFDRKEVKDHGDGGLMVGKKLADGDRVVLVEDVVTAGTTLKQVIPMLRSLAKIEICGVVLSVDRKEKGSSNLSAVAELQQELKVNILPIVTVTEIIEYLSKANKSGFTLSSELLNKIDAYRKDFGYD